MSARADRLRAPLLTVGALSAATLALRLRDPHQHGSWGLCPLAMMGVYCPGCGGLRAVNDLTHGDVGAAASSNVLVTAAIPVVTAVLVLWGIHAWRGTSARRLPPRVQSTLWSIVAVAALGFTVLRNTPQGAWLAP